MVDCNKCSQYHRANIVRVSRECRENVVQHSPMIRAIIVLHSCNCRRYVLFTLRSDRNVKMVAMSHFCRQDVSQICLEIVANCSHPSEIRALLRCLTMRLYPKCWLISAVKRPHSKRPHIGFQDQLSLQRYCRLLSAIPTFIELPFVIKIFVLSSFDGRLRQVLLYCKN